VKSVLTIAGSDSSGGAGIQADLKTMTALSVFGQSAITALTAQNTTGVFGVAETSPEFLALQIKAVFEDIRPDAVKIGMVASVELIETIAASLQTFHAENIVLDPVMVATSGASLATGGVAGALAQHLFPLACLVTPNLQEASVFAGCEITCPQHMIEAAHAIQSLGAKAVLVKGGHLENLSPTAAGISFKPGFAYDVLVDENGEELWFSQPRIETQNTHGTGCTLSSAIASYLARGYELPRAVEAAKHYLTRALAADVRLGKGSGPVNHGWNIPEI
jgi:hydroxymethylpyrimidine/phosphomethylpyrimidine kinase